LLALFIFTSSFAFAQPRRADFLNIGINGGAANYRDRANSQGLGVAVSADLNINSILFANVAFNYNAYGTENNNTILNFGIKTFVYRMVYIHPYAGYARILTEPTVKRGTLGLGVGAAVPLDMRHINFEAGIEALPWYAAGTYYLFGKMSFPLFYGNLHEDDRNRRR
jgi:hypothetical protein